MVAAKLAYRAAVQGLGQSEASRDELLVQVDLLNETLMKLVQSLSVELGIEARFAADHDGASAA